MKVIPTRSKKNIWQRISMRFRISLILLLVLAVIYGIQKFLL